MTNVYMLYVHALIYTLGKSVAEEGHNTPTRNESFPRSLVDSTLKRQN